MQGDGNLSLSMRNARNLMGGGDHSVTPPPARGKSPVTDLKLLRKSPHAILAESGSAETVRHRNAVNTMRDFFGM